MGGSERCSACVQEQRTRSLQSSCATHLSAAVIPYGEFLGAPVVGAGCFPPLAKPAHSQRRWFWPPSSWFTPQLVHEQTVR